jgi:hypoxanthine phosphoribosyltransferase
MKRPRSRKAPSAAPRRSPRAPEPEVPAGKDRSSSRSQVRELTWVEFDRCIQALAQAIRRKFAPEAVVGVAHGGVFAGGAVAAALKCDFYPVRISRRSRDVVVRQQPRMSGEMPKELKGRRVLVVDDVASSGDTLELARALLSKVGARQVSTACLVSKPGGYRPDWTALPGAELTVFPWDYETVAEDARFDVDPDKAGA